MRRLLFLIAAVLALGASLPWLSQRAPANGPVIALKAPVSLDPVQASEVSDLRLLDALFEPLTRLDPDTLSVVPALAECWQVSDDGCRWTFTLRADAQWSDGTPVTAADMRRGLLRHLDLGSPMSALLKPALPDNAAKRIVVADVRTLIITTAAPLPFLPALLATPVFVPAHASQSDAVTLAGQASTWSEPTRILGNGPLRCVDYLPRHHYDLAPSPTYHGPHAAAGPCRGLVVADGTAAVRLYLAGQVDVVLSLPPDAIPALRTRSEPGLLTCAPSWGTEFYRVRRTLGGTGGGANRAAELPAGLPALLARHVDRAAICTQILGGTAVSATTLVVPGIIPNYASPTDVLTATNAPLTDAERALCALSPRLSLIVPAESAERVRVAEFIADTWQRQLGIAVQVEILTRTLAKGRERERSFDLLRGNWAGDVLDPTAFLDQFRADSGNNRTGWRAPTYDAALDAATGPDRLAHLAAAERLLLIDPPIIPLYHNACVFLVRPGITGVRANALELVHLFSVAKTTEKTRR